MVRTDGLAPLIRGRTGRLRRPARPPRRNLEGARKPIALYYLIYGDTQWKERVAPSFFPQPKGLREEGANVVVRRFRARL